jgi:2-polyprenyl-3-methyl-5-hydroxy-6-metoxy-1,4-benzoquinol methylase
MDIWGMEERVETLTNQEVAEYYDKFWPELEKQHQAGINSRHRMILYKLKKSGLRKNSTILEIGCGVGALTGYLAKHIPDGKITGVDISPASVEFAKKKYAHLTHVDFLVADMTSFGHQEQYDIILFPDVLEHIPTEAHENIFKTVSKLCKDDGMIAINLPQPNCVRWFHKNKPEILQIIDLAIETDHLINILYPLGFQLFTKETYILFLNKPEYEWMVFKRKKEFTDVAFKSKWQVLLMGLKLRWKNFISS